MENSYQRAGSHDGYSSVSEKCAPDMPTEKVKQVPKQINDLEKAIGRNMELIAILAKKIEPILFFESVTNGAEAACKSMPLSPLAERLKGMNESLWRQSQSLEGLISAIQI